MSLALTWNVKLEEDDDFAAYPERYLGTATSANGLVAQLRLWNNRCGTEDEGTLKDFAIRASFSTTEDSSLLKYCNISYDGLSLASQVTANHIIFTVPKELQIKGTANNGIASENQDHYADFNFSFAVPDNVQLKENDIKNLYLEIVHI